jgi:cytochrome P450
MDVLGRAGFGCEFNSLAGHDEELGRDLQLAFSAVGRRAQLPRLLWPLMSGHRAVEDATARIRAYMEDLIDARLREWGDAPPSPAPGDILSLLLAAGMTGEDALSREDIRDEGLMFYAAGHETTANTLAWTLFVLAERPALCERLRAELRDVCGLDATGGHPGHADVVSGGRLPLLEAVINETMRLYPVVPMTGRETARACTIEGAPVPAGTNVILSLYTVQRDPAHWGDRAEEFDESRWLVPGFRPAPGTFCPFGFGAKSCMGTKFALIELKIAIAALVRKFSFARPPGAEPVKPVFSITLGPKDGLSIDVAELAA